MRKLLNICTLVFSFCLCGCSDDDGPVSGLKVLSTTAKFDASGGEGKIEVQSPVAISAVSEENWCTVSVSGQTVNVTVPVNETITGRTAMVVITAGDETLKVPVYQAGDAFICDLSNYRFPMEGGSRAFSLKTARVRDVSVKTPEWLKYEIQDEEIVFTADPAESDRSAEVTVSLGKLSMTAVFSQTVEVETMEVEGTYSLSFVNADNEPATGMVVVRKNDDNGYSLYTDAFMGGITIPVDYDKETNQMIISFEGQILGTIDSEGIPYYVVLCALSEDDYIGLGENIQYVAKAETDGSGNLKFEFKDNGTWINEDGPQKVVGIFFGAFTQDFEYAGGGFDWGSNLVMTKEL